MEAQPAGARDGENRTAREVREKKHPRRAYDHDEIYRWVLHHDVPAVHQGYG